MACEEGWRAQDEFNSAKNDRVKAEDDLNFGEGDFDQRWKHFEAARDRWSNAILNRVLHIRDCPNCFANPPA
jgi:hypothetical protein